MREILKGIVDLHVHAGPSVAKRALDAAELLKSVQEAGYRAIVVKDHYFPTMMGCEMVQNHFGDGTVDILGTIVLNNSMGVFNLKAVDSAFNMGAKLIFFPTVSAKQHIDSYPGGFVGGGSSAVREIPVEYVDKNGVINPDAIAVLEYMAKKDMALGTGHGSAWEIDHIVRKAFELGVKRILINHPHFHIGATYEQMSEWAKLGAYIELNASVFSDIAKLGDVPWEVIDAVLKAVPLERIIIDSDLGQKENVLPVEGMYNFIQLLMERNGLTANDIDLIAKSNPAALIGLD